MESGGIKRRLKFTWEAVQESVVGVAPAYVNHGSERLLVVLYPFYVIVCHAVWHPGWLLSRLWDRWYVLEVRVHVVRHQRLVVVWHVPRELAVGM